MNRDHEQIAFGARRTKIADVSGVKQIKYTISKDDPASRAAMFLEHFVQTAAGKNFVARIHQELSIAGQVCDAARESIIRTPIAANRRENGKRHNSSAWD